MLSKVGVFICALLLSAGILEAYDPVRELTFQAGWRRDEIDQKVIAEAPRRIPFLSENLKARNLDIWQVGLDVNLAIPECACDCIWLNSFFVKGSAYWGWGDDGKSHNIQKSIPADSSDDSGITARSKIHHARTWNYTAGLGWLLPVTPCFGIGPVAGWSYDKLEFRTKHGRTESDFESDVFVASSSSDSSNSRNGLRIDTTYRGPWVGVDLIYTWCEWALLGGYEYHWVTRWNGKLAPSHSNSSQDIFKDFRGSRHGFGNVVYLDARWNYCECWEAGLCFKYKYFKARNGNKKIVSSESSSSFVESSSDEISRVRDAKWISYWVTLELGYLF